MLPALPSVTPAAERQVTSALQGHRLTNVNVWSADGAWIVYDTRPRDDQFLGRTIERVSLASGAVEVIYTATDGAHCGVVTAHPLTSSAVFILGPERPTPDWSYATTRRRGVVVDAVRPGKGRLLDAMTYGPPFVPGALRGGSHVHVFSPDGTRVSFTYDDEVLARLGSDPDAGHDLNQRNLGVSLLGKPVRVGGGHPRNQDGDTFSVVVSRTVNRPRPGSDEISRACEEGWVGLEGYLRADGSRQRYALAFQGTVTAPDGSPHVEVFIVDLPDDLTQRGEEPLEGTAVRRPAPPPGVRQRRLTFTAGSHQPGVAVQPRHWLRASPDGSQIAFLMKDGDGVVQLWTVSPNGGPVRQVTRNVQSIASAFTWSPDGRRLAHVMDDRVCLTEVGSGLTVRLTPRTLDPKDGPRPFACVFSPDGRKVAFARSVEQGAGRFDQIFVVDVPAAPSEQ